MRYWSLLMPLASRPYWVSIFCSTFGSVITSLCSVACAIAETSGKSVMHWINRAMLLQAKVLLKSGDLQISEIADRLNFPSQTAFGYFFKRETGMTPTQYRSRQ